MMSERLSPFDGCTDDRRRARRGDAAAETVRWRWRMPLRACVAAALLLLDPSVATAGEPSDFAVPDWLYPVRTQVVDTQSGSRPPAAPADPEGQLLSVPNSRRQFTLAKLRDYFAAPDWHPQSHTAAPAVVMSGRKPDVLACGFCHLPDGAGRPENAALAGLSDKYIVEQLAAFASGARRTAWTGTPYLPTTLMTKVAAAATPSEVASAAAYFSSLRLRAPRAKVIETERIPRLDSFAWIHSAAVGGGQESLGMRLIEVPADLERHELRDSRVEYVAYVPPGSVTRGRLLATDGTIETPACTTCHGRDLRGVGDVPPIAGRSPTYLLRQLVAFRTGVRSSPAGAPMVAAVATLTLDEMIGAAAYAASLQP